jgi:hypothetical protein
MSGVRKRLHLDDVADSCVIKRTTKNEDYGIFQVMSQAAPLSLFPAFRHLQVL